MKTTYQPTLKHIFFYLFLHIICLSFAIFIRNNYLDHVIKKLIYKDLVEYQKSINNNVFFDNYQLLDLKFLYDFVFSSCS